MAEWTKAGDLKSPVGLDGPPGVRIPPPPVVRGRSSAGERLHRKQEVGGSNPLVSNYIYRLWASFRRI